MCSVAYLRKKGFTRPPHFSFSLILFCFPVDRPIPFHSLDFGPVQEKEKKKRTGHRHGKGKETGKGKGQEETGI
jgi:hypothetical protein